MKYIKIVLFTAIIMILVLFAVRNQGKVNFVLGYKTAFTKGTEVKEDVKKELKPESDKGAETAASEGEVPPGTATEEEATKLKEEKAPEPVVEKAGRTIGYEREYEIPLFLLVFIEAFVLIVLMSLVGIFEDISLRHRIRELTRENKKIKSELNILKKGDKESEKIKVGKAEEGVKVPETKDTAEKKPDKVKKEAKKKKSLLKNIKGEKKTPPKGPGEDKGL